MIMKARPVMRLCHDKEGSTLTQQACKTMLPIALKEVLIYLLAAVLFIALGAHLCFGGAACLAVMLMKEKLMLKKLVIFALMTQSVHCAFPDPIHTYPCTAAVCNPTADTSWFSC